MEFSRKRWFTLWEVLIIVIVVSIGLMSIISLLTYGLTYVQKSRQKIIALNLAREGIEAMYQIRDTNRQRWFGMKEYCWLKTDPLNDGWDGLCQNDSRMQSWSYILDTNTLSGQRYFLLTGYSVNGFDSSNGIDSWDLAYSLCISGGLRVACPGSSVATDEGRYFREIRWYGLFDKSVSVTWWVYMDCPTGSFSASCSSVDAKEFRFCSRVTYMGYGTWEVELCGVFTNFMDLKSL